MNLLVPLESLPGACSDESIREALKEHMPPLADWVDKVLEFLAEQAQYGAFTGDRREARQLLDNFYRRPT